jgi:hypothetical protein
MIIPAFLLQRNETETDVIDCTEVSKRQLKMCLRDCVVQTLDGEFLKQDWNARQETVTLYAGQLSYTIFNFGPIFEVSEEESVRFLRHVL